MHSRDGAATRSWSHDSITAAVSLLVAVALPTLCGCVHDTGEEAKLAGLETGLESEFPNQRGLGDLKTPVAPTTGPTAVVGVPQSSPVPAAAPEQSAPVAERAPSSLAEDPNSPAARPVIRIVGSGRPHTPGQGQADDRIEVSVAGAATSSK
jgi:hypothetical protein